jgi:uncharacterized Zn finger protein
MSEVETFFRFCPVCGKRFHIKVIGKELVGDRVERESLEQTVPSNIGFGQVAEPVVVEQGVPVTIDYEDFQYTYKCKHCGHVWTEIHEKEEQETS